jgi:hypothetical protein
MSLRSQSLIPYIAIGAGLNVLSQVSLTRHTASNFLPDWLVVSSYAQAALLQRLLPGVMDGEAALRSIWLVLYLGLGFSTSLVIERSRLGGWTTVGCEGRCHGLRLSCSAR